MITASINIAPLLGKLQRLGSVTKEPMQQLVRDQARLFISSSGNVPGMIQVTPPFSQGTSAAKAKKQGEGKVRRDIRRVYGLPSDLFALIKAKEPKRAGVFWALMVKADYERANNLAQHITGYRMRPFDGGAAHLRRRNADGQVRGRHISFYVLDPIGKEGALDRYIDEHVDNVGTYASGFNAAALQLGAKGVPGWVLDHGTRFSGISIQETPTSFYITIDDRVPFGISDTIRRMDYVLRYRGNALTRSMPHIIRNAIKKSGLATTAAALT